MCTCITYTNEDFYFGRNLDLEYSFGESVVITPQNYSFSLRRAGQMRTRYAMIGMAAVAGDYPLYAEAVNEKGLCLAGLNFPGNACYQPYREGAENITPFELIPWILGQCAGAEEAEKLLENLNILDEPFSASMPLAPLHWMMADREKCLVLEATAEGLQVYENPVGILTNNPPFSYHLTNLRNYLNLTPGVPENRFAAGLKLTPYGQGMGALGLPGDVSPASRFVRAAFLKWNSVCEPEESASVTQFFHILDNVSMVRGAAVTSEGKCDITTYSCCVNADRGIYYYKTYGNSQIRAAVLGEEECQKSSLTVFGLENRQQIHYVNGPHVAKWEQ